MKCDVCGREFNNSDEVKQHQEQMHPRDEHEMKETGEKNPEIEHEGAGSELEIPTPVARTR